MPPKVASLTPHAEPTADQSGRTDRQVITYLAFAGILLALGIDIALPAYDDIAPAVGLESESPRITLIITVYFFGMAFGQLLWGPLADRFGRMFAMSASVGLYVVAALLSTFAPNFELLLAARALWGVGAAGPAGLRAAIARDLYSGNQMARVMSMVMAIFMAGPILSPLVGEVILLVASWQWVFGFCAFMGVVLLVWTRRFGETLDPAQQRELDFGKTLRSFGMVLTTRTTIAYTLALSFSYGTFYIFLGSTQRIMSNIYDLGEWFSVTFAAAGVIMAFGFFGVTRLIGDHGARNVSVVGTVIFVVLAGLNLVMTLATDGRPSFALWLVCIVVINQFGVPLGPTCFTLGLEPMGELAGTASSVMGFLTNALGAGLAAIVDARIGGTVTAMAVAYLGYGTAALLMLLLAAPAKPEAPLPS